MQARFVRGTFARIRAVLEDNEDRTDFVRTAVERELAARRPRARAPPTSPQPERAPRVDRREAVLIDDGGFGRALAQAAARGKERPPALAPDTKPGTRFPTRLAPP
jgi:hypothetical protein